MTGDIPTPLEDVRDLILNHPVVDLPKDYNSDGSMRRSKYGRIERLGEWMAACQRREKPKLEKSTIALFAGTHGLAKHEARQRGRHVSAPRARCRPAAGAW